MAEGKLDVTDELLVAYVDDELDASQRQMVASVLAGSPALSRRADEMRLARDLLNEAYPLRPDARVPPRIKVAANRLAEACARQPSPSPSPDTSRFRHWRRYAVAAGVVLVVAASAVVYLSRREAPVTALLDIHPGTPLYDLLESRPSGAIVTVPKEAAVLRAVLTFRTRDGRFCREFEILAGTRGATGVACRDRNDWRAEVLMSTAAVPPDSNSYTPAGESDAAAVAQVVERLIQGDPLGSQDESLLLASGWLKAGSP